MTIRNCKILVVDDDQEVLKTLGKLLKREGFDRTEFVSDGQRALEVYRTFQPDLVILDLNMPVVDGYQVMERLQQEGEDLAAVPILAMTADMNREACVAAYEAGARDVLSKPFDLVTLRRIENTLESRMLHTRLQRHLGQQTAEVERSQLESVQLLAIVSELRDDDTGLHIYRVGRYTEILALLNGSSSEEARLLRIAASLHDLGKVGIPERILSKPDALSPAERREMEAHTTLGAHLLGASQSPILTLARDVALHHHEWWDGSGYPNGLAGDDIPFGARAVALADSLDVLMTDRPYRAAFTWPECVELIDQLSGVQFDPELATVFSKNQERFANVREESRKLPELFSDSAAFLAAALLS